MKPAGERRESLRFPTRLYVRGLGENTEWQERLGDLGLGGVGFEAKQEPKAGVYHVVFTFPGEAKKHLAFTRVVAAHKHAVNDRHTTYFVHTKFLDFDEKEQRALARILDRLSKRNKS